MTNQNLKIVPYNLSAEQSVLGSLMFGSLSKDALAVLDLLKPESFYRFEHREIFAEIQALAKNNQPIDLMTVEARLSVRGITEQIGGFAYLAELSNNTPSAANIRAYAEIVREDAIKRFTLAKLQDCEALIFAQNDTKAADRIEAISRLMSEISDYSRTGKTKGLRTGREVGGEWLNEYEKRLTDPNHARGISTGLTALDEILGIKGLVKQSLVAVGARPKCGKTAFYSLMAENCLLNEKKPVLLFSLEMSSSAIFERMVVKRANVNVNALYDTELTEDQFSYKYHLHKDTFNARIASGVGDLVNGDLLYIDDTPNVSMAHIRSECRRIKRERGEIGLIGVDYLTLMKAEKAERNDLAYGQITKELKNLAREMDCVVLLLTQLNRGLESRTDKRPMPSDSRDTGQIEQECDYWIGLHREHAYNEKADPALTEVLVRLNRHGATGKAYCDQKFGAIFECDQDDAENRRSKIGKVEKTTQRTKQKDDF